MRSGARLREASEAEAAQQGRALPACLASRKLRRCSSGWRPQGLHRSHRSSHPSIKLSAALGSLLPIRVASANLQEVSVAAALENFRKMQLLTGATAAPTAPSLPGRCLSRTSAALCRLEGFFSHLQVSQNLDSWSAAEHLSDPRWISLIERTNLGPRKAAAHQKPLPRRFGLRPGPIFLCFHIPSSILHRLTACEVGL